MGLYVILGATGLAIIILIIYYNKLVSLRIRSEEALSDIEVQLKRRYDLIPNLISTVEGYAKHESSVFEKITTARAAALKAGDFETKNKAENNLSDALKSVFAVAESYPDLKASQNFMDLQNELTDTEDKIQAARRFYNANVRDLNIAIEVFPSNLIAKMFSFEKKPLFDADDKKIEEPVKVKF